MSIPAPIAIWRLSPAVLHAFAELPAVHLALPQTLLSPEERRRAAAFHAEEDRRLYLAAHIALRLVLSRRLHLPPAALQIAAEGGAKPALHPPSPLRFNLAHTRGAILIAAGLCELGVDIERHRPLHDLEALASSIASPAELAAWQSLAPAARILSFYRLWTRKEAYLKAIGLGLFRDLAAITVPITPNLFDHPVQIQDQGEALPHSHWSLCDLPAWENYSAALCWPAPSSEPTTPPRLEIHDLTLENLVSGTLS